MRDNDAFWKVILLHLLPHCTHSKFAFPPCIPIKLQNLALSRLPTPVRSSIANIVPSLFHRNDSFLTSTPESASDSPGPTPFSNRMRVLFISFSSWYIHRRVGVCFCINRVLYKSRRAEIGDKSTVRVGHGGPNLFRISLVEFMLDVCVFLWRCSLRLREGSFGSLVHVCRLGFECLGHDVRHYVYLSALYYEIE